MGIARRQRGSWYSVLVAFTMQLLCVACSAQAIEKSRAVAPAPGGPTPAPRFSAPPSPGAQISRRLVGDFSSAAWPSWDNVTYFPWSRKNAYTRQGTPDGDIVKVVSNDAASMFVRLVTIDWRKEPMARWYWKIQAPLTAADERQKSLDDCAARVYFVWGLKSRKDIFSAHGLVYTWGQTRRVGEVAASPFTDQIGVVTLRAGRAGAGSWQMEERDLEQDYQRFFKRAPQGVITAIALLTDTDHTDEQATAWYGPIAVGPRARREENSALTLGK